MCTSEIEIKQLIRVMGVNVNKCCNLSMSLQENSEVQSALNSFKNLIILKINLNREGLFQ